RKFIDQGRQRRPRRRPFQDALRRRHERDAALAVFAKQPEIGRGVAEAEHALALHIGPSRPDAAVDQLPRHDAEAARIEITEVDDVDGHGRNLTRRCSRGLAKNCIAAGALTPYFLPIWGVVEHDPENWAPGFRRD